ncbi:acyl-CoA dehydrogenase family protein, partial [Streptomyces sp. NPDC087850]
LDPAVVEALAEGGHLASFLPREFGARGIDHLSYGFLHETIGAVCTSTRSLITVHDMLAHTVWRWGDDALRATWLPALAAGTALGAFALSEPDSSSEAAGLTTYAETGHGGYVLRGRKKWISFGQIADVFLVFARMDRGTGAFLVPRDTRGLTVTPIRGLLGARASMLAELSLDDCRIPAAQLLGRPGRAVPQIVASSLTLGRLGVAAGSTGLVQGCLDTAFPYARERRQGDGRLGDRQLIQRLLAGLVTDVEAARLLWLNAASLMDGDDPRAPMAAMVAKHFAAGAAARGTRHAVQILGAAGCTTEHPVERMFRDAKVMEIIEGSNEIQQITLGRFGHTDPLSLFPSDDVHSVN